MKYMTISDLAINEKIVVLEVKFQILNKILIFLFLCMSQDHYIILQKKKLVSLNSISMCVFFLIFKT